MVTHLFGGLQGNAGLRKRRRQQCRPVVDAQARGDPHLLALTILANKLPALILAPVAMQTLVAGEIGQMTGHAVAIEVVGRRAEAVVLAQQRAAGCG